MRKHSAFQCLVEAEVQESILKGAYEDMGQAYKALDKAHESYSNLVDKALIRTEGDYLDVPLHLYSEAQVAYSRVAKKRERALSVRSLEVAKSRVIAGMQAFKGSCKVLTKMSSDKSISFTDMRTKLWKIEAQYVKINTERADVESRAPSSHNTELAT